MTEERKVDVEVDVTVEKEHPGTGEPMVGIEVPADGTEVTITNEKEDKE